MDDLLPAAGAVHPHRLIQGGIDAHDRRHKDDGVEAEALPGAGNHIQLPEPGGHAHEVDGLPSEGLDRLIDDPAGGAEEVGHHAHHDHRGDEIGQVGHHLRRLREAASPQLRNADGEDDRNRKSENQRIEGKQEGVPDQAPGEDGAEKLLEPPEADPGAAEHAREAAAHLEVLKGHRKPHHGQIAENDIEQKHRQEHQHQLVIPGDQLPQAFPAGLDCVHRTGHFVLLLSSSVQLHMDPFPGSSVAESIGRMHQKRQASNRACLFWLLFCAFWINASKWALPFLIPPAAQVPLYSLGFTPVTALKFRRKVRMLVKPHCREISSRLSSVSRSRSSAR